MSETKQRSVSFDCVAPFYRKSRPPLPQWVYDKVNLLLGQVDDVKHHDTIRFLDIATGTGVLLEGLRIAPNIKLYAVDQSADMLSEANANGQLAHISFHACDAHNMPFEDGSIDMAVICQAFHLFESSLLLRELDRILTVDGIFVVITSDLISCPGSPAYLTNMCMKSIVGDDGWPAFSDTGLHPKLLAELEQGGFIPYETLSKDTYNDFSASQWHDRVASSSMVLKISPESVQLSILSEHKRQMEAGFAGTLLRQRQRCWIVTSLRKEQLQKSRSKIPTMANHNGS